jgi:hypothetical protein
MGYVRQVDHFDEDGTIELVWTADRRLQREASWSLLESMALTDELVRSRSESEEHR